MKNFFVFLLCTFFASCITKTNNEKKNVTPTNTQKLEQAEQNDTTRKLIAALPFHLDSTKYIVHTIGYVYINHKTRNSDYKSGSYDSYDYSREFALSYASGKDLNCWISNMIFENIETGITTFLTKKRIQISQFYRFKIKNKEKNKGKEYIVFRVYDADTNSDSKLDSDDLTSLYISNIDGSNFRKISPKNQEVKEDSRVVNRLYFTTLQDINKDKRLNELDEYHNYFIDFEKDTIDVKEYNVLRYMKY